MIAGATYTLPIDIGAALSDVAEVIVTLRSEKTGTKRVKRYPHDYDSYLMDDGRIGLRLSQRDTLMLVGRVIVEAQINLIAGSVAKTITAETVISDTLGTEFVPGAVDNGENMLDGVAIEIGEPIIPLAVTATDVNAVHYTPDKKNDEQKKQARENIGAQPAGDYALRSDIPSKVSELENDSGFITRLVSDLANYYTKAETAEMISSIPKFAISVVDALPTTGISDTTVYLVRSGAGDDLYTEYIYVGGVWEVLGAQRVDLTGYATEAWVSEKVQIPTSLAQEAKTAASNAQTTAVNAQTTAVSAQGQAGSALSRANNAQNMASSALGMAEKLNAESVKHKAQSLTDAQKAQARENIGALGAEDKTAIAEEAAALIDTALLTAIGSGVIE